MFSQELHDSLTSHAMCNEKVSSEVISSLFRNMFLQHSKCSFMVVGGKIKNKDSIDLRLISNCFSQGSIPLIFEE